MAEQRFQCILSHLLTAESICMGYFILFVILMPDDLRIRIAWDRDQQHLVILRTDNGIDHRIRTCCLIRPLICPQQHQGERIVFVDDGFRLYSGRAVLNQRLIRFLCQLRLNPVRQEKVKGQYRKRLLKQNTSGEDDYNGYKCYIPFFKLIFFHEWVPSLWWNIQNKQMIACDLFTMPACHLPGTHV
ncbi:hypothetical protein D3C80_1485880 [compost metagenome]